MTAPAIRTERLRKVYRVGFWMLPVVGLVGLDLEVRPGEAFGFIGPNGAGKTTALKLLLGLQRATSGSASLLGKPCTDPEARMRVGFLPERPYFYDHLTGRELLLFYGSLHGLAGATCRARAGRLLERMDLGRFADVQLRRYSKGMLQRVGLCQALVNEPDLVILDEPMSGLDPVGRALVRDAILAERAAGRTVFFSSHVLPDVELLCDRVAVLVGGELSGVGTVDELLGNRVAHVDCAFAGVPDLALPGTEVRRDGVARLIRMPPDDVDAALAAVHAAGGRVLQVSPVRRTLEELLLDEVDRKKTVHVERLGVLN